MRSCCEKSVALSIPPPVVCMHWCAAKFDLPHSRLCYTCAWSQQGGGADAAPLFFEDRAGGAAALAGLSEDEDDSGSQASEEEGSEGLQGGVREGDTSTDGSDAEGEEGAGPRHGLQSGQARDGSSSSSSSTEESEDDGESRIMLACMEGDVGSTLSGLGEA